MTRCKSCGAEIKFIRTENARNIPQGSALGSLPSAERGNCPAADRFRQKQPTARKRSATRGEQS